MALRRQQAAKIMCLSLSLNLLDQKVQKRYRHGCLSQGKSVAKENKMPKKTYLTVTFKAVLNYTRSNSSAGEISERYQQKSLFSPMEDYARVK